jgi:hypothetical protein
LKLTADGRPAEGDLVVAPEGGIGETSVETVIG